MIHRLLRCKRGTAAVEAAIFAPIYLTLTLGITDLGSGMFARMQVNAAAQVGAAYAVINSSSGRKCSSMTSDCLSGIQQAMNDATGNPSFCTGTVCTASFTACAEANGGICYTVSANYPFRPILPDAVYTWAQPAQTYSYTVTVRVPT
jgi:Flp pilus assembly protein TadG